MICPSSTETIAEAAALLRDGQLVAFPTETVYGLGANALDAAAVRRIYDAKGRPSTSPLIVHVDSIGMARSLAAEWPDAAESLASRFWPGPLTLVVRKQLHVPDIVTAGLPTVGLRIPSHPVALQLIRCCGVPLAAPSANRFTELSPTRAEHVERSLGDRVPMILDGGACQVGIESTVVSVAGARPVLLRHGSITVPALEALIGQLELGSAAEPGQPHAAPGQHPKHYSPRTPLLIAGRDTPPADARVAHLHAADVAEAALYELLHTLDAEGHDAILVTMPPDTPEFAAVRDRLTRAAARE
ncbi:MAG: threonylcarbamoyl-AMP synthase [Acidobacteria bacterium]|nr:threonylcarbamoyl-AMP synthase [Acidobacteriota bacterium]